MASSCMAVRSSRFLSVMKPGSIKLYSRSCLTLLQATSLPATLVVSCTFIVNKVYCK